VGATSQPLGFPAPLARRSKKFAGGRLPFAVDKEQGAIPFRYGERRTVNGKRLRNRRRASGTGHAHRLSIRSTPEIRYGSNGFRALTCVEVPLRAQL